jgi:hypothetical protein
MAQQLGASDLYTDGKSTRGLDGLSCAQTRHDSLAQDTTGFNHTQTAFAPGMTNMSEFTTGAHNTAEGRTRNMAFNTTMQSATTFGGSPSEASPFGQSKGSMQGGVTRGGRNGSFKN